MEFLYSVPQTWHPRLSSFSHSHTPDDKLLIRKKKISLLSDLTKQVAFSMAGCWEGHRKHPHCQRTSSSKCQSHTFIYLSLFIPFLIPQGIWQGCQLSVSSGHYPKLVTNTGYVHRAANTQWLTWIGHSL